MRNASFCAMLLLLAGCSNGSTVSGLGANSQQAEDQAHASTADAGEPGFECEHGGAIGKIEVFFACDEITVYSCKDISNVVIEYEDGERQRYEGGMKGSATLAGSGEHDGKGIVGVWVKAGANSSGDGPGYGERFEAPDDTCEDAPTAGSGGAGSAGAGGEGGAGGSAGYGGTEAPCVPGLDTFCDEGGSPSDPGPVDFCLEHPTDPSCAPD